MKNKLEKDILSTKTFDRPNTEKNADLQSHDLPLIVDLDGTLIRADLLYESFLNAIFRHGWRAVSPQLFRPFSIQRLKAHFAGLSKIDYAELPYNEKVLAIVTNAIDGGRKVYLATASDRSHADAIAENLGIFDGVFASDEGINLKGKAKAEVLVAAFGDKGFDYIGNDAADLAIWRHARHAYSINLKRGVTRRLQGINPAHTNLENSGFDFRALIKALRPHQYAKNGLIFVPLLTAHAFNATSFLYACMAFIAFSLCASCAYVLNDLLDLHADRGHPSKKKRPFATGRLSIKVGMLLIPILAIAAFAIAWFVSPAFVVTLAVYFAITNAYSFSLKRRMIIDVVALALLYTIRVFAGAAAIHVQISEWLFTFSLFIFTALALIKRYTELSTRLDRGLSDPTNRNYKIDDLPVISALAAAAGMNSVMVLAFYTSSSDVAALYSRPYVLWGLCPLFLYWIARALMLAHRRLMDDDPIVFGLTDSRSWAVGIVSLILVIAAL